MQLGAGEGVGRRAYWGFGFSRCKLLYVGWIAAKSTVQHRALYAVCCDRA